MWMRRAKLGAPVTVVSNLILDGSPQYMPTQRQSRFLNYLESCLFFRGGLKVGTIYNSKPLTIEIFSLLLVKSDHFLPTLSEENIVNICILIYCLPFKEKKEEKPRSIYTLGNSFESN